MNNVDMNTRKLSLLFYEVLFIASTVFFVLYRGLEGMILTRLFISLATGALLIPFIMSVFTFFLHKIFGMVLPRFVENLKDDDLLRCLKWVGRCILLMQMVFCFTVTFLSLNFIL